MRYFIGDTETTGLRDAAPVELAMIEIDPDTLQELGRVVSLIDPERDIEPGAQAIHGITAEMVADAPTMCEFVEHVLGGKLEEPCVLVAHNVVFDERFFRPFMNISQTFCTLRLARRLLPTGPANHKLGTLREYLGLAGGAAHRALGDVLTVHEMLQKLLPETGRTLRQHLTVPAHTAYTMPWGDHKGKLLADIPVQYRTWLLSVNIDAELRQSLMRLRAAGI